MNLHLWFDSATAPELAHYGAALGQHMRQGGWSVTADYPLEWALEALPPRSIAPAQSRVVSFGHHGGPDALRVSLRAAELDIVSGQTRASVPFAVSPSTFPRRETTDTDQPRLLFHGEASSGRRVRMTTKVIAEMRRRRFSFRAVWYGPFADDLIRGVSPDELHESLLPPEFAELFSSATCILEASDQIEMLSSAFAIGWGLGIPTVCHRDVAMLSPSCIPVDEWSADAFAEAVMAVDSKAQVRPDNRRWSDSLDQFEKVLRGVV